MGSPDQPRDDNGRWSDGGGGGGGGGGMPRGGHPMVSPMGPSNAGLTARSEANRAAAKARVDAQVKAQVEAQAEKGAFKADMLTVAPPNSTPGFSRESVRSAAEKQRLATFKDRVRNPEAAAKERGFRWRG